MFEAADSQHAMFVTYRLSISAVAVAVRGIMTLGKIKVPQVLFRRCINWCFF